MCHIRRIAATTAVSTIGLRHHFITTSIALWLFRWIFLGHLLYNLTPSVVVVSESSLLRWTSLEHKYLLLPSVWWLLSILFSPSINSQESLQIMFRVTIRSLNAAVPRLQGVSPRPVLTQTAKFSDNITVRTAWKNDFFPHVDHQNLMNFNLVRPFSL